MVDTWSGPVGRLNAETSDGRIVQNGGFTVRTLPLPLDWQERTDEGHENAITVGTITDVQVMPDGTVWASGEWLDPGMFPDSVRARALANMRVVYPSMEAAGCEMMWQPMGGGWGEYDDGEWMEPSDTREVCVFTSFEFAKVTLVAVQAFPDLYVADGNNMPEVPAMPSSIVAAGVRTSGWSTMPVADTSRAWNGSDAASRVADWSGINGDSPTAADWAKYARGFLYQDPDANPQTRGAYKLGIADVINGELTIVPRGVYAVAGILNGARGGANIPQDAQDRLKTTVTSIYNKIAKSSGEDVTAPFAIVASAAPAIPPQAWFANPQLDGPTALTITDDGRVYGHAALWDVCHIGIPGCTTAPRSMTNYAYFMLGSTMTDAGEIPTGKLTVGGGHADGNLGFAPATEHYDNIGTAVANVVAGEDDYGIWVSGALLAGATPDQVEALRRSPLSGDWRDIGGNLEAVAFHAVNTPGFPVPRARAVVASSGRQTSLVASSGPRRGRGEMVQRIAREVVSLLASSGQAAPVPPVVAEASPSTPTFSIPEGFVPAAGSLREQFDAAGIPWPTITLQVGDETLPAFDVAEGCVRAALAKKCGTDAGMSVGLSPRVLALAQARLALQRARA